MRTFSCVRESSFETKLRTAFLEKACWSVHRTIVCLCIFPVLNEGIFCVRKEREWIRGSRIATSNPSAKSKNALTVSAIGAKKNRPMPWNTKSLCEGGVVKFTASLGLKTLRATGTSKLRWISSTVRMELAEILIFRQVTQAIGDDASDVVSVDVELF